MGVSKQHKPNRSRKSRQSFDCILKALHWLRCFSCLDKVNSTCYQDRDGLSVRHIKKTTNSDFLLYRECQNVQNMQNTLVCPHTLPQHHDKLILITFVSQVLVRFTLSSGTELYLQGFKDGLLWHVSLFLFKKEHQRALFYWPLESHPALLGRKNYFCFELRSLVTWR